MMVIAGGLFAPSVALAACPAVITLSVAHGGSVSYDGSICDAFGLNGNIEEAPLHGTAISSSATGFVTYTHFGGADVATFDTFVFDDASNINHRVNVTIGAASAITVSPGALGAMRTGVPFTQTLTATGGVAPYTYAVESGSIPGLSLSSSGVLSGTPSHRLLSTVTIRATDGLGDFALKSYSVDPENSIITMSPTSPPNAGLGVPYSVSLVGAGGVSPYIFALAPGSAASPPGLSVSTSGVLGGTPSALGTYVFRLRVTDSSTGPGTMFAEIDVTLTVAAAPTIVVNPATLPGASVGVAYSQTATGSGGTAPYTLSVSAGALPAGLSLNGSSGAITGTPTASGSFNFTLRATDNGGFSGTRAYSLVVAAPTTAVSPPTLPNGAVAAAYNQAITASGGIAPYTYAVTAGALPAGLSLSAGGVLSGTPVSGGNFNFTATATGSSTGTGAPHMGSRAYSLVVAAPTILLPATGLSNGTVGSAYSATLNAATGGTSPYTYAITAGALPAGLSLSSAGALSGTPTTGGTFNFSATATDSSTGTGPYSSAPRAYALTVIDLPPVANAVSTTVVYNSSSNPVTLSITGGSATSVAVATAPAHGTASATGTSITYSPAAGYAGPDSFTYTATNGAGTSAPATVAVTVTSPALTMTPPAGTLTATYGQAYAQSFVAAAGAAPYTFIVSTGALPAGLSLASDGTMSGTPTAAGSFTVSVTATDSSTGTGPFALMQNYTLQVATPTFAITPPTLVNGAVGVAYSQTISASGGIGSYSYAVTAGALPAGLSLNASSGALSGTVAAGGTFNFTVTASDSNNVSGSRAYALTIAAPVIAISPPTLPDPVFASAYSQSLTPTGGTAPYSYSVTAGALPAGLGLDSSTGAISGTPTATGTFSFTVTATDSSTGTGPYSGSGAYTLTVTAPTVAISSPAPGALPAVTAGAGYSQLFAATGGTGSHSFALVGGALPAGVSLSATGLLSGTPTVAGAFSFDIQATDSSPAPSGPFLSVPVSYALTVTAPAITLATTLPMARVNAPYSADLAANGGTAPYSLTLTAGAMPPGIFIAGTGLSGTPTSSGTFVFSITATDANGFTGSQAYSLIVDLRPDPRLDANVMGIINAQGSAANQQASVQIGRFWERLHSLRGGAGGESLGVSVSDGAGGVIAYSPQPGGPAARAIDGALTDQAPLSDDFGFWFDADLTLGSTSAQGTSFEFEGGDAGLGVDYRVNDQLTLGIGLATGLDRTRIGADGTQTDLRSGYLVVYGTANPIGELHVDAVLGAGVLNYSSERFVAAGDFARGTRTGQQMFGSLGISQDFAMGALTVSPYGRLDLARAWLDPFTEVGSASALHFDAQQAWMMEAALGIFVDYDFVLDWGTLTPSARFEYKAGSKGSSDTALNYADFLAGPAFGVDGTSGGTQSILLGLGTTLEFSDGLTLGLDYSGSSNLAGNMSHRFGLTVGAGF